MSSERLPPGAAIMALTRTGLGLAQRLKKILPGARTYGRAGRVDDADETFAETTQHLRHLFAERRPIVAICATGIVIRALAPALADKRTEPPVLAVSEDGASVVPLLGGHTGANRLAQAVARATQGHAAVTNASDVAFGLALDDPPPGWRVANPEAAKGVVATLLADQPVRLVVEAGDARWLTSSGASFADQGAVSVLVTDRRSPPDADELVLYPPVLALGVGCERGADAGELIGLAEESLAEARLAAGAVACVCSLDLKSDEPAVEALARHLGVPTRLFAAHELEALTSRLANPSETVFREVGCHGVAEGAALAAAGTESQLVAEKRKKTRSTCAIARSRGNIDATSVGRARGRLTIVGIGPGADAWRTPAVNRALAAATDVVGYRRYLDLLGDAVTGKALHDSGLSYEEERTRLALDLAAQGGDVALVSSGDAGIYALAALAFELLDRDDDAAWNRIALKVEPGVSAVQAAAARLGAPIGNDFCTVSLSDLLTPWDNIVRRLRAAAEGDFVIALYNPVSKRRKIQLALARDILLASRDPQTPVALARNVGRDGEAIEVISLAELTADKADMLTIVLVGNSQTRLIERGRGRWLYTPRGYEPKLSRASNNENQSN